MVISQSMNYWKSKTQLNTINAYFDTYIYTYWWIHLELIIVKQESLELKVSH